MNEDVAAGGIDTQTQDTAPAGAPEPSGNEAGPSLLSRDDAPENDAGADKGGGKDQPQGENGKDEETASLVPAKAEDYRIAFGGDVPVDEKLLAGFKGVAHELGLHQGQAQTLADFYAEHVADLSGSYRDAQFAALQEAKRGWESEITARPGFKQEITDAKRTIKEFGSPGLIELMDQSLLGSHPVFFDFVVKVGKALAEPEVRGKGTGGKEDKPLDQRMWPGMK